MAAILKIDIKSFAALLLTLHVASSAKQTARPVHEVVEVINEQARIDEKLRAGGAGSLPYGNPLAGNVKQNIRLHAYNQQAMFNAERIRQHKAQIQRWTKAPQLVDSYMKAYHESQESHQLALEEQQATLLDAPITTAPRRRGSPKPRQDSLKSGISPLQNEPIKITKADAVKTQRNRSHRSYGSAEYQQYLQPKRYKTVYVSPAPTYDQGVTIKPNGNIGYTHIQNDNQQNTLYTQAGPSSTQYIYPKQYSQMHGYQSIEDINTLNSLLKKDPREQLSAFNSLLNTANENSQESDKNNVDTPIDLYFYLKDPPTQSLPQHHENSHYAQMKPNTYAAAYLNDINALRDYTPIMEEVDDIEDPNQFMKIKPYLPQPVAATPAPELSTTTKKSNNYYKVEVASQTITAGHAQNGVNGLSHHSSHKETAPAYGDVYSQQPTYFIQGTKQHGDLNERYLHNVQPTGVQRLNENGVGVSAYGDENVSIRTYEFKVVTNISIAVPEHARNKREVLETEPFLLPNETQPLTEMPNLPIGNDTSNDPQSESLVRLPLANKNRMSDFNLYVTNPTFPIGESVDYSYNDYDDIPLKIKRPSNHKLESTYEDEDYSNYNDDFSSPDYDVTNYKTSLFPASSNGQIQSYAPSANYAQSPDLKSSVSNKFGQFKRFPNFASGLSQIYGVQGYGIPPGTSYGVPEGYGVPPVYGPQNFGSTVRYVNDLPNIDNILEPVYMLTQSQLQNLIGHHNLNIQHLDVYQLSKDKRPIYYPRKYKKRYPYRNRNRHVKKNLHKLHKLHVV